MSAHKLTFELASSGDELRIHADVAGLRFLAKRLTRLAEIAAAGRTDHEHLMTEEWGGQGLTSEARDSTAELLNKVTIHAWPLS
jgi:hypothetical protein